MNLRVTVAWSEAPRAVTEVHLDLPMGATVFDALESLGAQNRLAAGLGPASAIGVWGKKAVLTQVLKDRDRVEIYRPLKVDPKTARRERFNQQGAGKTGLFAKRRAGAKPGY